MAPRHPFVLASHGPRARAALWDVVLEAKGDDPLAPVSVAVPSPYAGLSLRRDLGGERAFVNVRFLPLARVAELLGAPYLAEPERRPLTPAIALGAVRVVLHELPGELNAVAGHPATLRGLLHTFTELRELHATDLERLAGMNDRTAGLVARYRRFRELTRDYYDDEDQLGAAADALDRSPALADLGVLIVYLPRSLSPGAETFVRALAERGRVAVVLSLTGDDTVDEPSRKMASQLEPVLGAPHVAIPIDAPPIGDMVVSCPDGDEEVRTVVRTVLERVAQGTPLHRMAVAYRTAEPYARILHEHFAAAEIPAHGPSPRRLADSAAGRLLLGMLDLPDADYRREAVMELLTGLPVRETAGGARVPGPRWDRLSCAANIVTGPEQWQLRLARHADHRRRFLERRAAETGALFSVDGHDRVLGDCERLGRFITELETRLAPPTPPTWPALVEWSLGLLDRYLGRVLPADAPESEQTAAERVRSAVAGLTTLHALGAPASVAALRSALDEELDTSIGHTGTFGDGVLVAPVGLLAGTDYDALFVVGMAEGAFPPSSRDDPLLPDAEREQLGGVLAGRAGRRIQERSAYLAALASARWRALSYPRADTRAMRGARPAPWLLETASAHAGRLVGAHELDAGTSVGSAAGTGRLRVVDSFDSAVRAAAEPASLQEHDLQWLLRWPGPKLRHPLVRAEPRLAAGLRAVRARTGHRLDAWDGVVDGSLIVLPGVDAPLSPTSLETWAKCPFRYLLAQVLHVRAVERPEARDRIAPRERGSLVHAVLEAFLRAHPRSSPEQPWSADERAELRIVAEAACDVAEAEGLTGREVLWRLDRGRILRELDRVLDTDEAVRAERELVPRDVEAGFGNPDDALPAVQLDLDTGRTVLFRGRIDRVDEGRDGHLEVFDYKTGFIPDEVTDEQLALDPVQAGTKLQLAIYGLAVRDGERSRPVRASYWYTRESGELAVRGFTLDEAAEGRIRFVLELVADEISAGHFPAYPGEDNWFRGPESCRGCDYDRLCPRDRVRRFERRRGEPAFDGILSLREPVDDDDTLDEVDA
jgi:ATP-dependent helicase/nuclease subunit B